MALCMAASAPALCCASPQTIPPNWHMCQACAQPPRRTCNSPRTSATPRPRCVCKAVFIQEESPTICKGWLRCYIASDAMLRISNRSACAMQVATAHARIRRSIEAETTLDMWSLGMVAYEVYAGYHSITQPYSNLYNHRERLLNWCRKPLFGELYSDEQVQQSLKDRSMLPWEVHHDCFDSITNPAALKLIRHLLQCAADAQLSIILCTVGA